MPRINILSPHVADMIAAGEVVERPASAVKELLENAIDAGARNVTVEISGGGAELIRVTDDGCGMSPEDAGVAFLRHATSKLADERGLEAIGTLGFRGEALAAIASVSRIELTTRERGAAEGTYISLEAGNIQEMRPAGASEGTCIAVRGLFFNTPARRKFLKSDKAEGAAAVQAAMRCALGRPDVSVRCIRDGKEEFFTPGDGKLESAVYTLLGRELANGLRRAEASGSAAALEVSGFVSAPEYGRGTRAAQYFFCNGRAIKSQLLQAAVEQAYRGRLLSGRFPACVLQLTISPAAVDVNVHPAKTEIKFTDEREVFSTVYNAVLGALTLAGETAAQPEPELPRAKSVAAAAEGAEEQRRPFGQRRASLESYSADEPEQLTLRSPKPAGQTRLELDPPRFSEPSFPPAFTELPSAGRLRAADVKPVLPEREAQPKAEPSPEAELEPVRVIGEALGLYILAQQGDELVIIDKHAAHERMLYDALMAQDAPVHSQALLAPMTLTPSPECAAALEANAGELSALGFDFEPFGRGAFILRAAPAALSPEAAAAALEEAAEALAASRVPDVAGLRAETLKTVACKAAVKAGPSSEPEELARLAEAVCSGSVTHCPHGRPVAWRLSRKELDRQFKRIL